MPIEDIFSKRQKRLRGEVPDVFQYTELPRPFRIQVTQIFDDALGSPRNSFGSSAWQVPYDWVAKILCREYGVTSLTIQDKLRDGYSDLNSFIIAIPDTERVLDAIELLCKAVIKRNSVFHYPAHAELTNPTRAIEEVNVRFFEHGIGYQFEGNELIRVDSKLLHSEVVKPVLSLLTDPIYQGANDEFLTAHEHYRHGNYKECLVEGLKAFESTMKAICNKRGWIYGPSDTAKNLITICFQNHLIPPYLESHFSSLRNSLESGVPTVRNKMAGHGQGTTTTEVPQYMASYIIHLTATTMLMLIEAEKEL